MNQCIAIIGGGNMGQAIAKGLLNNKTANANQLLITNSETKNNKEVAQKADIIILAVKPQQMDKVLEDIQSVIRSDQLFISIAAGIRIKTIQETLCHSRLDRESRSTLERGNGFNSYFHRNDKISEVTVVRVMPNIAAKVGQSMSVWVGSKGMSVKQKEVAKTILGAIGKEFELDSEEKIDIATAISGSGPAYYFYVTEQIEHTAKELGLSSQQAKLLATQTLVGSAELVKRSNLSAEELRHAVTSKGGTTEAAIKTFKKLGLQNIFREGIFAAFKRASELGKPHEEKNDKINT